MHLLSALPSHLPSWVKDLLVPDAPSDDELLELKYDEWPEGSSVVIEGKRGVMPAKFRFGPNASKSVTLRPERALKLTCVVGAIWITRDRDNADYVLSAGQTLRVDASDALVAFALQFGVLLVEPAERT